MIFYLIRHGKPDYTTDTLLPVGQEQARLCAERMKLSGVDRVYSSPMGRAKETAAPLAEALGLEVTVCEWARELGRESKTLVPDGVPKLISSLPTAYLHSEEFRHFAVGEEIENMECLTDSDFPVRYREISQGLDSIIAENGYVRNPDGFYEITAGNDSHVALYAHAGMGRVVMSHLLHVPFQYFGSSLLCSFTGVTAFVFENAEEGKVISPRLAFYGDIGHLYASGEAPVHYITKLPI